MHKLLILVFISYFSIIASGQRPFYLGSGQKPTCVSAGDYCNSNSDCCSQNCTQNSTTRRCERSTSAQTNDIRTSTLASRFGDEDENEAPRCQKLNGLCAVGRECCSKTCFKTRCVEASSLCSAANQKCSSSALGCCDFLVCERGICRDKSVLVEGTETFGYVEPDKLNNRFGEGDSNQSQAPALPTPCKDIGGRCMRHEECCAPLLCHSFLHQCVT